HRGAAISNRGRRCRDPAFAQVSTGVACQSGTEWQRDPGAEAEDDVVPRGTETRPVPVPCGAPAARTRARGQEELRSEGHERVCRFLPEILHRRTAAALA